MPPSSAAPSWATLTLQRLSGFPVSGFGVAEPY
jgi:hypothetical protein